MKKSLLKLLGVAAITCSTQVSAAGIGGINVASALGQPLKADIELVAVDKSEKSSLVARLATPEAYKSAGLEYPFGNKYKFTIENRAGGESFIHATSAQPVNDPFVSLLVELSWSSGKLVREFTFLLDPVGYQPEQPVATPVQAVAPVVAPAPVPAPVLIKPVVAAPIDNEAMVTIPIESEDEASVAAPVKATKAQAVATKHSGSAKHSSPAKPVPVENTGDITVKSGDTLNKIAAAHKVDGVSLERMLVALYRANADQFDAKNMNRIKTGKILRMPDANELQALTQADAKNEIHAQVGDWNSYRQKIASAAPASAQQQAPQQISAGKISSTVADKTPVANESTKEVLKLSKGDALTDKASAAGKPSAQDKKNAAQEDAIAKAKAAGEERTRVALLEKQVEDMKHLAELKTQAAALAKPVVAPLVASAVVSSVAAVSQVAAVSEVVASQVAAASSVNAASEVLAASAVDVVSAVPVVTRPKIKPVVVEPSMVDTLLGNPLYLGGGAAAVLGLGGLALAMSRRKKQSAVSAEKSEVEDFGSVTGRITAPVQPSPDTGDFTVQAGSTQTQVATASDDDPISEADLFLSFGRDAQAEEILNEALQTSSNKTPIKLKLLEIYAGRKDAKSFAGLAGQMKGAVDDKAWQQVLVMGRKLEPQNPLYGAVAKVEDSDSATMQTVALSAEVAARTLPRGTDLNTVDLHMGKTAIFSADDMSSAKNAVMDLDVTATNPSLVVPSSMDFDVTATHDSVEHESGKSASLSNLEDLIFDVTSTHPSMPVAKESLVKPEEAAMPFMLDFPIDSNLPKTIATAKPVEFNLADIDFNMGEATIAVPAVADKELWHEVATKLDLAKAYHEMGDAGGAREILAEVMAEGDAEQRAAAQVILQQLG